MASVSRTPLCVRVTGLNLSPALASTALTENQPTILGALDQRPLQDKWSVQSSDIVDNGSFIAAAIIRGDIFEKLPFFNSYSPTGDRCLY
jgi:hypothetical protein